MKSLSKFFAAAALLLFASETSAQIAKSRAMYRAKDVADAAFNFCLISEAKRGSAPIQTSGSSTTITASSGTPFANLVAQDILLIGSTPDIRRIVTATSPTSVVVDSAINLTVPTGFSYQTYGTTCGTGAENGWMTLAGRTTLTVTVDTLAATSVDYVIEYRTKPTSAIRVSTGSILSSAVGANFFVYEVPSVAAEVRVGLKVTGDAGVQAVSVTAAWDERASADVGEGGTGAEIFTCSGSPGTTTTGTVEEVLASCTLPAGLLNTDGMRVEVTFTGETAATANTKQWRIRVGGLAGTLVADSTAVASNNQFWTGDQRIVRRSATTVSAGAEAAASFTRGAKGGATAITSHDYILDTASVTWANAQDVVITATTPTASGDATLSTFRVGVFNDLTAGTTVNAGVIGTANTVAKFSGGSSIANSSITDDGNAVVIGNGLTRNIEANTAGSGAPNVLTCPTTSESFKILTNEGTTVENYHTLPSAATGCTFQFYVQDADGLRVTAAAGDTIRVGNSVSATAGYVHSFVPGASLTLTAINATEWVATGGAELWIVDGWQAEILGVPNPKRYVVGESEFLGGTTPFAAAGSGAGAGCSSAVAGQTTAGVFSENVCTTGSTAAGFAVVSSRVGGTAVDNVYLGLGTTIFDVRVMVPVLSDGAQTFVSSWGFNNLGGNKFADLLYDHTVNAGNFSCRHQDTVLTRDDSTVPVVAGQYYRLTLVANPTASELRYYIDGTLRCTVSSEIPSGTAEPLTFFAQVVAKSVGTTPRLVIADYARYITALTTPR